MGVLKPWFYQCTLIYEPWLVNFGTSSKWPLMEVNILYLCCMLFFGYAEDTNNAYNWYLVAYDLWLQHNHLLQVLFINITLLRLLVSWGAAFIFERIVMSCNPGLCEDLMGMVSNISGHSWGFCHFRMDICPKRGKKWGIGCLKPPILIIQNDHKWAFFALGLCCTHFFFFDGVQIGSL